MFLSHCIPHKHNPSKSIICSFWSYLSSSHINHDSRLLTRVETDSHSTSEASSKRSVWHKVLALLGRAVSKKQHTEHVNKKDKAKKYNTKALPMLHQEHTFTPSSNSFLHNNCWNQALFAFTNSLGRYKTNFFSRYLQWKLRVVSMVGICFLGCW